MSKVAFLGLGAMGSRMAANLVKSGADVTVWNRNAEKATPLVELGAKSAPTPREAVKDADIIISMVTDDEAAKSIWLDPATGAIAGMKRGAVAVESSTVTPSWVKTLETGLKGLGISVLDAPVAGSRPQAEAGQLVFMIGGDAVAVDKARPVLQPLAASILHVGALGQGAILKLAVNTLFAAQLESVAELLGFLSRNGFEANEAAALLGQFPIVAPPIAGAAKMMAARNTAPLFTIDLIAKDLGYILSTAKASGADLPGARSAHATFQKAQEKGLGGANVSGLASLFA